MAGARRGAFASSIDSTIGRADGPAASGRTPIPPRPGASGGKFANDRVFRGKTWARWQGRFWRLPLRGEMMTVFMKASPMLRPNVTVGFLRRLAMCTECGVSYGVSGPISLRDHNRFSFARLVALCRVTNKIFLDGARRPCPLRLPRLLSLPMRVVNRRGCRLNAVATICCRGLQGLHRSGARARRRPRRVRLIVGALGGGGLFDGHGLGGSHRPPAMSILHEL
jgi:hypothetical protein